MLADPEVGDEWFAAVGDQDVARLEVAVEDLALVGVGQRVGQRPGKRVVEGRPFPCLGVGVDVARQVVLDPRIDEIGLVEVGVEARAEQAGDVGVVE